MASLYEQYMASVSAMDERREQERQLALQRQALQLRERSLLEQIRAAGVSESQAGQLLQLNREKLEEDIRSSGVAESQAAQSLGLSGRAQSLAERQYDESQERRVPISVDYGGQTYDLSVYPEQFPLFMSGEQATRSYLDEQREREENEALLSEFGEARRQIYSGGMDDQQLTGYVLGLNPKVQAMLEPDIGAYLGSGAQYGQPQTVPRGIGAFRTRSGQDPFRTIFDTNTSNITFRQRIGATRSNDPANWQQQNSPENSWNWPSTSGTQFD